jgi:hypothetical protein
VRDHTLFFRARDISGNRLRVEGRGIDVEAGARVQQLADDEADRQRQRGHDLEVEQCLHADPPDLRQVAHGSDAVHDGAEDHRRDHHLDELDEPIAERLERGAGLRRAGMRQA